jgi:pyruvate/2-oxoglutarate dehydrogenase complex dihydrolipoamide acyltransferase (E2) component
VIEITPPEDVFEDVDEGVEGLLEAWLVEENDRVAAEEPVADAVVIKTSFQVLAPAAGTIAEIVVPKGDTFAAGAVLARLEANL